MPVAALDGGGGAPAYDSDAQAYLTAAGITDPTRSSLINDLVVGLKADAVWASLDALWLLANLTGTAARVNMKLPGTYDLSAVNVPTFTTDRGYQGDGSTSYLDTGTYISGSQNNSHLGIWSRTAASSASSDIGNSNSLIVALNGGNTAWRTNGATSQSTANPADGTGHFVIRRNGGSTSALFRNGASLGTSGNPSQTPNTTAMRVLSRSVTVSYSIRQLSVAHAGLSLSDTDVSNLYTRLGTYLTAIGA